MAVSAMKWDKFIIKGLEPFPILFVIQVDGLRKFFGDIHINTNSCISSILALFCFLWYFMNLPKVLPSTVGISSSQYSCRKEYKRIETGTFKKSSLSRLNFLVQYRICNPANMFSKSLSLSSREWKMVVKNPLEPSRKSTWPFGFHHFLIHLIISFHWARCR